MLLEYFNESDLHFQLLAGVPTHIEGACDIYSPSLKEIAQIKMSTFNHYISMLLIDRGDYDNDLPESWSNFDLLCSHAVHDPEFAESLRDALRLFFKKDCFLVIEEDARYIAIGDSVENNCRIDSFNFPQLQEFIMFSNRISKKKEPEYNPGNSMARQMLDRIMKNKAKLPVKNENPMDIISIANALGWRENGVSIHEVFDLTSYQVYEGFFTMSKIDDYKNTIIGIYSRSIDGSKIKFDKIHWANKIKTKME